MKIEKMTAILAGDPTADQAIEVARECAPAKTARRQRLEDIRYRPGLPMESQSKAYREAIINDPEGLDAERSRLQRELAQLDAIEAAALQANLCAADEALRSRIKGAKRQMPKLLRQFASAIAELDKLVEKFNSEIFEPLAEVERLTGKPMALDDDQLAELGRIRQALWTARNIQLPIAPAPEDGARFPKAWPLFYERRGGGTIIRKRPPSAFYLPDART